MTRQWRLPVGLAVLLSACQLPQGTPGSGTATIPNRLPSGAAHSGPPGATQQSPAGQVRPSESSLSRSPSPQIEASSPGVSPAPTPSASPSASASPLQVLRRPDGQTRVVKGSIAIDAHYAFTSGSGRIVSNNGANTIQFGSATIVGNNGGNIISDNGGGLIGKVKAPTIGIVSNNGGGYRVLQASADLGEILPAAGLALRVGSLRTGDFLPLGVDAAGKPIYEVYSDAQGHYEVYLPAGELNNVLLVAQAPGSADARLGFSLVVPEAQVAQALDDDSSLVAGFLRTAFAEVLLQDTNMFLDGLATQSIEQVAGLALEAYPEAMRDDVRQGRIQWLTAAVGAGAGDYSAAQRRQLAQRLNDTILSYMTLEAVQTTYAANNVPLAETAAVPALIDELRRQRESVTKTFQRLKTDQVDPRTHFASRPYVKKAEESLGVTFTIATPSDAIAFSIYGILANIQMTRTAARTLYEEAVTSPEFGMPTGTAARVFSATQPIYSDYLRVFYYDPEVAAAIVNEAAKPIAPN